MVPLATPARRATSSSRAAAKPEAENSSSAAARMASRRAVLTSLRRRAGARRRGTGAVRPDERAIAPAPALTDQSVIMPAAAGCKRVAVGWNSAAYSAIPPKRRITPEPAVGPRCARTRWANPPYPHNTVKLGRKYLRVVPTSLAACQVPEDAWISSNARAGRTRRIDKMNRRLRLATPYLYAYIKPK